MPIIMGLPTLILVLFATRQSRRVWIALIVVEPVLLLLSLGGGVGNKNSSLLIPLLLHIAVLVLALVRSSRAYYRGPTGHAR